VAGIRAGDGKESGPATTAHLRDPPILPVQSGSRARTTAASVGSNMSAQRQPLSMPKRSTSRLKKEPSLGMMAARGQRRSGTADARSSRSTPSVLTKQRGARAFHPPGKNERPASASAQKLSRHSSQALPSRTVGLAAENLRCVLLFACRSPIEPRCSARLTCSDSCPRLRSVVQVCDVYVTFASLVPVRYANSQAAAFVPIETR